MAPKKAPEDTGPPSVKHDLKTADVIQIIRFIDEKLKLIHMPKVTESQEQNRTRCHVSFPCRFQGSHGISGTEQDSLNNIIRTGKS